MKKYFYALRTSLAALWIAQNQSAPPMTLSELRVNLPAHLNELVDEMIALKAVSNEKKIVLQSIDLHRFIQDVIDYCQSIFPQLPDKNSGTADLNRLFKNILSHI